MSRVFSFIAVLLVAGAGMYIYMQQAKAVSQTGVEGGTANPRATIDLAASRTTYFRFPRRTAALCQRRKVCFARRNALCW